VYPDIEGGDHRRIDTLVYYLQRGERTPVTVTCSIGKPPSLASIVAKSAVVLRA
jgi:hypothetical protein